MIFSKLYLSIVIEPIVEAPIIFVPIYDVGDTTTSKPPSTIGLDYVDIKAIFDT